MHVSERIENVVPSDHEPLAIVGIGCRLPGNVIDAESFWNFLADGRSGIVEVPPDRWTLDRFYHENPAVPGRMYTRWGGFVPNLEQFDARFWGITPREAMRMDPQQRWLLEVAWEAIEDSGTPPTALRGKSVGVFVGISTHDYSGIQGQNFLETDSHTNSGSTLSIASNRISYLLDLKGPSLSVDTACSSSLVALSIACRSIWAGECEAALVGGVNLMCAPHATIGFAKASMLSPDGQCFAFDARANGYVRGEGAGVVYFKRLSVAMRDQDPIYAVIRAAVINQDGHTSSMTVPGADAQAKMLRQAYEEAGISPHRVSYMEAHGTGTPVGDPIEALALGRVLSQGRAPHERCLIGSVKSNIGHLEAGSGIAGLIKAALVLQKGLVPPNQNYQTPSPYIPFDELKLQVADKLQPLPRSNGQPPVTAVNSFGFGGTNSHAVLEAAPAVTAPRPAEAARAQRPLLLPISARGQQPLVDYARSYLKLLKTSPADLAEICYSAGQHKEHHDDRLVVIGENAEQMTARLESWLGSEPHQADGVYQGRSGGAAKPIVFVMTGQGAQWWAMGQQLIKREPIIRQALEQVDEILVPLGGFSLIEEMSRDQATSRINDTNIAQPAIFGLQFALAELWRSWGIVPAKVVGHSVGEVAAAYVAGVYDLEDAIKIIYHRSRLQHTTAGLGKMLAAGIRSPLARHYIGSHAQAVQVAAVNSPNLITLAGNTAALEEVAERLAADGKFIRWLAVDYPFHTHVMEPIKQELLSVLRGIQPRRGRIPFVSTVTGGVFQTEKMDATYWWSNVRNPVLFAPAIANLIRSGEETFLEIGPHPALKSSVSESLTELGQKGAVFYSLKRETNESEELLSNVAAMHLHGVTGINWSAVNQSNTRFRRLPQYPWHRETYWLEAPEARRFRLEPDAHPLLGMRLTAVNPTWQFELDPRVHSYLESHRFWDSILFPAAGYGEIAIALARTVFPDEAYTVEDLAVKKALFVAENNVPTVRVEFNPVDKSFTISSSTGEKQDWELHVTGRLTLLTSPPPPPVNLGQLRDRLSKHITHQQYYTELDAAGFHFGPHFKLIRNVYAAPGEALIEVPLPEGEIACKPGHIFHPILLDACLQVGKAAIDADEDSPALRELYLPRQLGRIRLYRDQIPSRFWAYGKQIVNEVDFIVFDIEVYDDHGERVCDILRFQTELMAHIKEADDVENCLYRYQWEPATHEETPNFESSQAVARTESPTRHDADARNGKPGIHTPVPVEEIQLPAGAVYAVLMDQGGFAARLSQRIRSLGGKTVPILVGDEFCAQDEGFIVNPENEEDLHIALSSLDRLTGVIHCWSLDHPQGDAVDARGLRQAQLTGVLSAMQLAHVLADRAAHDPLEVFVITRDAQAVIDGDQLTRPLSAPTFGMARVAYNENPAIGWRMIDLEAQPSVTEIDLTLQELLRPAEEHEVAIRAGQRYAARVQRVRAADFPRRQRSARAADGSVVPYHLQIETPGILSNLLLHETTRRQPGPGEIEAQVMAAGINFRNVMKALGMPIGNTIAFPGYGEDFAGVIVRVGRDVKHLKPGDAVLGMGSSSFRSYVTTDARAVFKKPDSISFADAATIPTVFSTAYYAIRRLANMRSGEKILIHAGTGGVGQAAIQIAREMGLEVFATAGSAEKRKLLKQLGADHVMNSRTLDFVDDIRRVTGGYGVDVVLNSLAGDFIPKSLSVLAPFGRFVEIGKVDIFNNSKIGMGQLKDNISFFIFDLIEYIVQRTDHVAEMFVELGQKFIDGAYQPLTHNDFPIMQVEEAYRYMAQGKHVGKNVLTFDHDSIMINPCNDDGALFRHDASYLVTGGASGLSLEVARWMAKHGAGHLVLMSRGGPRDEQARATIEKIKSYGTTVTDARGDVTSLKDVTRVVGQIAADGRPPLKGVIHGAMVLHDELLSDLDQAQFDRVLRPKMDGAWNLHVATRELPLEHFICFSSFSAVIGAPKQANYNAGNVFLDALAHHRHALGLPALTINWGALSGTGFVARNEKTAQYLDAIGMKSIHFEEALKVLRRMLQFATPQVMASRCDWQLWRRIIPLIGKSNTYGYLTREQRDDSKGGSIGPRILAAAPEQRPEMLERFIAENLAAVCSIEPNSIDFDVPLTSLGLDSLMAVELMNRIEGEIGLSVPMGKVLAGPSIRELGQIILQMFVTSTSEESSLEDGKSEADAAWAPLQPAERHQSAPLSEQQQSIWQNLRGKSTVGAMPICLVARVTPRFEAELLERAWTELADQHAILRARLIEVGGRPEQHFDSPISFELHEGVGLSSDELAEVVALRASVGFDLETGPVARLDVINADSDADVLALSCHPFSVDRASMALIMQELLDRYGAMQQGSALERVPAPIVFQDFVHWELNQIGSSASRKRYEFWRDHLLGAPVQLRLPSPPAERPTAESRSAAQVGGISLDAELNQRLLALAAEQDATPYQLLLASYQLLLHLLGGQKDLIVGCELPGRQHRELASVVGPFAGMVPLRSRLQEDLSFADLLQQTQRTALAAARNQQYPLRRLATRLGMIDETGQPTLYDAAFVMAPEISLDPRGIPAFALGQSGHSFCAHNLSIGTMDVNLPGLVHPLTLCLAEAGGSIYGRWFGVPAGFTAKMLTHWWQQILRQVAVDPVQPISQIRLDGLPLRPFADWVGAEAFERVVQRPTDDGAPDEIELLDPRQESQLDPSIAVAQDRSYDLRKRDRVLLTGATGFVGAHLIAELLEKTDAAIYCLVRGKNAGEAMERLQRNMIKYELDPSNSQGRLHVVLGDLTLPKLGLAPEKFAALARDLDVIYHNGADINIALPYARLRPVNVNGTHEILRLALEHHFKPTHVVSSYAVHATRDRLTPTAITESEPLPPFERLANGYSKSKWVVENLVANARRLGLPVNVYRPGNITGNSVTGASNTGDVMHTLILSMLHVGAIPDTDAQIDLTPVDYVAGAIVEISLRADCQNGTFHLLNPHPLHLGTMTKLMRRIDPSIDVVTLQEFRDGLANLEDSMPGEVMGLLSDVLTPDAAGGVHAESIPAAFLARFDCQHTLQGLRHSHIKCHPVDEQLLERYVDYLRRVDFFEVARRATAEASS